MSHRYLPANDKVSFFSQIEEKAAELQSAISEGANSFLFTEYRAIGVFMVRTSGYRIACGFDDAIFPCFVGLSDS